MCQRDSFFSSVCSLAIPVALQSMLQASFSIVDQIMIGQLGSVSVAGVGLAGKFASIYSVIVSAVGVVAGIMISQYLGQKNQREVRRSFLVNLLIAVGLAGVFTLLCGGFPAQIMGLYTTDAPMRQSASVYLQIITATYLPLAGATLLSTLLRCMDKAQLPLYASIASAVLNTGLNYLLIFGRLGLPAMGASGAAIATVISTWVNFLLMLAMLGRHSALLKTAGNSGEKMGKFNLMQYFSMLMPILVCEFLWSLGENIYAAIYGHMGTDASAAMTLINPVQSLVIGALCGLSQAASVIIGKELGSREYNQAYRDSWRLIRYGLFGAVILSALVVVASPLYVQIYQVDDAVKLLTRQILLAYALIAPFKVLNMIAGGGILRSGGKTNYVMWIDMIGTWVFGVPLGLLSAFVWKLSIPCVYFILSLEECVRFGITVLALRSKRWMQSLGA
ncbi:MAG: MATE family efflux transporter [Candidatus Faecousia sp.]|nr:MATE family efflux transporter [Candidatus Faecousia sp.]